MRTLRDKPGRLIHKLPGLIAWQEVNVRQCPDCNTTFTSLKGQAFTINRVVNDGYCPWCREDSEPWRNGRGI